MLENSVPPSGLPSRCGIRTPYSTFTKPGTARYVMVTPCRKTNLSCVLSSFQDQLVARSGTIDCRLFCATCWSNSTRLLNTGIIGPSETTVASSRIDMLAGLSRLGILKMPPLFCASAAPDTRITASAAPNATRHAATARSNDPIVWFSSDHTIFNQNGELTARQSQFVAEDFRVVLADQR